MTGDSESLNPVTAVQKRHALMWAHTALSCIGPGATAQMVNDCAVRACTSVGRIWHDFVYNGDSYESVRRRMLMLCETIIELPEVP